MASEEGSNPAVLASLFESYAQARRNAANVDDEGADEVFEVGGSLWWRRRDHCGARWPGPCPARLPCNLNPVNPALPVIMARWCSLSPAVCPIQVGWRSRGGPCKLLALGVPVSAAGGRGTGQGAPPVGGWRGGCVHDLPGEHPAAGPGVVLPGRLLCRHAPPLHTGRPVSRQRCLHAPAARSRKAAWRRRGAQRWWEACPSLLRTPAAPQAHPVPAASQPCPAHPANSPPTPLCQLQAWARRTLAAAQAKPVPHPMVDPEGAAAAAARGPAGWGCPKCRWAGREGPSGGWVWVGGCVGGGEGGAQP